MPIACWVVPAIRWFPDLRLQASLFVPCTTARCEEIGGPLPVVVFLHGFSYQLGFTGIYGLFKSSADGGLIHAVRQLRRHFAPCPFFPAPMPPPTRRAAYSTWGVGLGC